MYLLAYFPEMVTSCLFFQDGTFLLYLARWYLLACFTEMVPSCLISRVGTFLR